MQGRQRIPIGEPHRDAIGDVLALRADSLDDLSLSNSASTPRPPPTLNASCLVDPTSSPSASCTHGGSASPQVRPASWRILLSRLTISHSPRSRGDRTRLEDRHSKFYDERENLRQLPTG
jgi:hypothetical protein